MDVVAGMQVCLVSVIDKILAASVSNSRGPEMMVF